MTCFERNTQAMAVYFAACAAMAMIYAILGIANGRTVLPESYGPLVYAMPALAWAGLQFGFAGMAMLGVLAGRKVLVCVFSFLLGALFIVFAVASVYGGATEVTMVAMAWPAAAICWLITAIAWGARYGRE